jgi:hypothetical protein
MFERLDELDLLEAIHPGLKWDQMLTKRWLLSEAEPTIHWRNFLGMSGNSLRRSLTYILWIIDQPSHIVRAVINRLRLTRSQNDYILASVRLWKEAAELRGKSPSEIVAKLESIPPIAVYANYLTQQNEEIVTLLEHYVSVWRLISPNIDGHDLRRERDTARSCL